ncbi:glycosyltransferase [Aquirufa nivalisilvae]
MKSKQRALFVISNALGHLNRAIQLANQLKENNVLSFFIVEEKYIEFIQKSDFIGIRPNSSPFGIGMENVIFENSFSGYLDNLIFRVLNRGFETRKLDYEIWLKKVKPNYIFLDYQFEPDLIVLSSIVVNKNIKIVIFQTIFNTKFFKNLPTIFSTNSPSEFTKNNIQKSFFVFKRIVKNWFNYLKYFGFDNISLIKKNSRKLINNPQLSFDNRCFTGFTTIHQKWIMLPIELEFDQLKIEPNSFYLGLYINKDSAIGNENDVLLNSILYLKSKFKKIIYVSLGTLHLKHSRGYSEFFFNTLIEVANRLPHYYFIISRGGDKMQFESNSGLNYQIENFVTQFELLGKVDLFLTHGGANSILESIFQECPMLVFPLNKISDQCGNSIRVDYFNLGKKMTLKANVEEIVLEIENIIYNYSYFKQCISSMKRGINYQNNLSNLL